MVIISSFVSSDIVSHEHVGHVALRNFDHVEYARARPRLEDKSIYWFRLVDWASNAYCDRTKWMEVRRWEQLPKPNGPGSVITLGMLGNCVVDLVFHIGGLSDLQALCVCTEDPSGTELLGLGLPKDTVTLCGDPGSPVSENFLFSSVGLSFQDLNNEGVVVFTVKWSCPSIN